MHSRHTDDDAAARLWRLLPVTTLRFPRGGSR